MNMPISFLVRVVSSEDATWQGKVTWVEQQQTQAFSSALELIKLLDRAATLEDDSVI